MLARRFQRTSYILIGDRSTGRSDKRSVRTIDDSWWFVQRRKLEMILDQFDLQGRVRGKPEHIAQRLWDYHATRSINCYSHGIKIPSKWYCAQAVMITPKSCV